MKKYIFIGSVKFSESCLEALLKMGINIVSILCPKKNTTQFNSDYSDFKKVSARFKRKIRYFDKISQEAEFIRSQDPDIIFVLGFSQLLPKEIISIPRLGLLGSHPAFLPFNRGRHPIIWALANGLKESGVTLFWIDNGVDSGDIWGQKKFKIRSADTAASVYRKAEELAVEILKENIPALEKGIIKRKKQDHSKANYWRKRSQEDGRIDWRMSSKRINDLVRALNFPYAGAHLVYMGKEYKVWKVRICLERECWRRLEPGKVILIQGPKITVKTGDGAITILRHGFYPLPKEGVYL